MQSHRRTSPCCGWASSYGTGALVEDNAFAQNAINAANAGLTVGVYFYSQAVTEEEAAEEARFVVERLRVTERQRPHRLSSQIFTRTGPGPTISPANRPPRTPSLFAT